MARGFKPLTETEKLIQQMIREMPIQPDFVLDQKALTVFAMNTVQSVTVLGDEIKRLAAILDLVLPHVNLDAEQEAKLQELIHEKTTL